MAVSPSIRVYPSGGTWVVKKDGASRASYLEETKESAIRKARDIAIHQRLMVIIHGKDGRIQKTIRPQDSSNDNCFITTACVKYFGLADDCYELQTLRKYRDEYLLQTDSNSILVQQYYSVAPPLVTAIESSDDKVHLFKEIFKNIQQACLAIEEQRFEDAKFIYQKAVLQLLEHFKLPGNGN